jgi:hypothetical protein
VAAAATLLASKGGLDQIGVSQIANAVLSGRKGASGLFSVSQTLTTALTATAGRLANILVSASASASTSGKKSALSSLVSSVIQSTGLSAKTHRQGIAASSNAVLTTLIGTGDNLIRAYGYIESSQMPNSMVSGFKATLGALSVLEGANTSASGIKGAHGAASSHACSATALIALAAKAGWLQSLNIARTLVVGVNPDANIPRRRYSIHAMLPEMRLHRRFDSTLHYARVV